VIGVDGCRGGWCGAVFAANGALHFALAPRYVEVVARLETCAPSAIGSRILVDMPIGLADGTATRACDDLARRALGPRRASVFAAPPRVVLAAHDHATANALARETTGRGLSLQTWHLVPRITDLDEALARDAALAARTFESHPELCFARLFGAPCAHGKRTALGRAERLALLERLAPGAAQIITNARAAHSARDAGIDDHVDALVLAVSAALPAERLEHLPQPAPLDARGRRMSIVAPRATRASTNPT
jgi:predicted RNase H-like nuclease